MKKNSPFISDLLFELVQSLSPTEKRYFKLLCSRNADAGKKKYEKLFDAISKQKNYNEWEIRKKLGGEKYVRQLPRIKNYLYEFIISSLNAYSASHNDSSFLRRDLNAIEILYKKQLFVHCRKYIKRATQKAILSNQYYVLLEIIKWEKALLVNYIKKIIKRNAALVLLEKEEEDILKKIATRSKYKSMALRALWLIDKEGPLTGGKKSTEMKRIVRHPYLVDVKYANTLELKIVFYEIHSLAHYYYGNLVEACKYRKKIMEQFKKYPVNAGEYVTQFKIALYNFITTSFFTRQYGIDFDNAIISFRKISTNKRLSAEERKAILLDVFKFQVSKYLDTGKFNEAAMLIEKDFLSYNLRADAGSMQFYALFFTTYFSLGNYAKALSWLNEIINSSYIESREDTLSIARILNLIVHYEIGNYEMIGNLLLSTKRYLIQKKRMSRFEHCILNFFKNKRLLTADNSETMQLFKIFKKDLQAFINDPKEKNVLLYFDFISWADSKIENKSFAEVMRKKQCKKPECV